jgi:peptidoglycan-associated lipoprotein
MSFKAITIGAAVVLCAATATAQQRGTVELGVFGSAATFNKGLTLDHGIGAGGHVGIYLDPRWALEFEKGEMRASRTLGLKDVNVGVLTARMVVTPVKAGRVSLLAGAGAGAGTETNFMHSYGVNALLGAKFRLSPSTALRVDGISDWLANEDWKSFQRVQVGLSFTRRPNNVTRDVVRTVEVPGPVVAQRPDSVSADEQNRRRSFEDLYRNLRDSLNAHPPVACPAPPAPDLSAMEDRIQFAFDKSDLTPATRTILDAKVVMYRANPSMSIMITGHTGNIGTDKYNMALGTRRADAAKAYLVSHGVDASRIETDSEGERNPVVVPAAVGMSANAPNRRAMFRLVVVSDVIKQ